MIFRQTDKIVKIARQQNYREVDGIVGSNVSGSAPDAAKMGDIMRRIATDIMDFKPTFNVLLPCC